MIRIMRGYVCFAVLGAAPAQAQADSVDTLIDRFLVRGALLWWTPSALYDGCPDLEPWQEEGIDRLMSTELDLERLNDLARSWAHPLGECDDARLNDWYIGHMEGVIARGEWARSDALRGAIYRAGTPAMQAYLRAQMLDRSKPARVRNVAGGFYFENTADVELMDEFLAAFATMQLPDEVGWGQATRLLGRDPDRLLHEVGRLVRGNAGLAEQIAFAQIVQSSRGRASSEARLGLANDLEAGLQNAAAGMSPPRRQRLAADVRFLRRQ